MKACNLHVVYELSPKTDRFFESAHFPAPSWTGYSGLPSNFFERVVRRPKVSRYRAALQIIKSLRRDRDSIVISHMPSMTLAVQSCMQFVGLNIPHVAFAFNYTKLPSGRRLQFAKKIFFNVDQFIVFSEFERSLYSEYFDISKSKFFYTPWTQSPPPVGLLSEMPFDGNYICAVGGEGRDYKTLVEAVKPAKIPLVIIGRPDSVKGVVLPDNVKFFSNLPLATTWAYAAHSVGMVLPLRSSTTCCGQITIVSARMLGIPVLCTDAEPLKDYFDDLSRELSYPAGSVSDLSDKLNLLFSDVYGYGERARAGAEAAQTIFSRTRWDTFMEQRLAALC